MLTFVCKREKKILAVLGVYYYHCYCCSICSIFTAIIVITAVACAIIVIAKRLTLKGKGTVNSTYSKQQVKNVEEKTLKTLHTRQVSRSFSLGCLTFIHKTPLGTYPGKCLQQPTLNESLQLDNTY